MSAFMDSNRNMQEESTAYIWLRYATQYTRDGQTHTLEMSVPVPVGATPEVRAQLFREAEEDMQQFTIQLEQHNPAFAQRAHNAQHQTRTAPQPLPRTKPTPTPQVVTQRTGGSGGYSTLNASSPANRPASQSAPPATTLSVTDTKREVTDTRREPGENNAVIEQSERPERPAREERTRNNSNAGPPAGENGGMPLPQFIQYIKDNLNLSPRQAMDILDVKSLATGINLRDALEQLKAHSGQSGPLPNAIEMVKRPDDEAEGNTGQSVRPVSGTQNAAGARTPSSTLSNNSSHSTPIELSMHRPASAFAEEIGPDELDNLDDLSDFDDMLSADDASNSKSERDEELAGDQFSTKELEQARAKLEALRSIQGATTANDARLKVLNNVLEGQITEDQLKALISGVWHIQTPKKLKVDQVEELISWAKREDAFIEQVEAILATLNM
ncbi:hypothetical protein ccbrp13_50570 [Ktedonobacteria bacterium brp13]|nr:hypothetical protein ccbrp13_50570 [Ktedonobacteria bacterium brp13]